MLPSMKRVFVVWQFTSLLFYSCSSLATVSSTASVQVEEDVASDEYTISFTTPNIRVPGDYAFMCMSAEVPVARDPSYIVDITAHPVKEIVSHIVILTCESAAYPDLSGGPSVWDCGEDRENNRFIGMTRADLCASKDTPEGFFDYQFQGGSSEEGRLRLPPGTGIPVGGKTGINTIVLSMHYPSLNKTLDGFTGESRVDVRLVRNTKDIRPASSLVLSAFGFLAPHSVSRISGSWRLDQDVLIHPVVVYHHSHGLAFNVNVLIERKNGSRELIHNRDPRRFKGMTTLTPEPQALQVGDRVVYECDFDNISNETIRVWETDSCHAYLFYYVDRGSRLLDVLVYRSIDPRDQNCFPPLDEVTNNGINIRAEYNGDNSYHATTGKECHMPYY